MGVALLGVAGLAACSTGSGSSGGDDRPKVVAAENFWGSIAAPLGGDRVDVSSIIRNPNADPHDYEPTTGDARLMASARFIIVNGIGYDPWADRLLAANPVSGRSVLNVGRLVGVPVFLARLGRRRGPWTGPVWDRRRTR